MSETHPDRQFLQNILKLLLSFVIWSLDLWILWKKSTGVVNFIELSSSLQADTFKNWINVNLKEVGYSVDNLEADFQVWHNAINVWHLNTFKKKKSYFLIAKTFLKGWEWSNFQ